MGNRYSVLSVTMISPQQEVPGTSLIPALKVSVPAVTKGQCLSESLAWVSSSDSPLGKSMRVVVAKRVKMEGQWAGAHHKLSHARRIIAVCVGGEALHTCRLLLSLVTTPCRAVFGNHLHIPASCTGLAAEHDAEGSLLESAWFALSSKAHQQAKVTGTQVSQLEIPTQNHNRTSHQRHPVPL